MITHQLSPRRTLRPGSRFRTIRGSGPTFHGFPVGCFSEFVCVRLYRKRTRLYAQAVDQHSGATHDLYIDGPSFTSTTGTRERPYKIKLLRGDS